MKAYRFGICARPEQVAQAAEAGFDYLELNLNDILKMDEDRYREMAQAMELNGIYAEVVRGMLPESLPILGPEVSAQAIHEALKRSFETARALGAEIVVFDCEKPRILPEDFDPAMAWRQLGNLIRIIQGHASDFNLRAALLPLRRGSADLMNHLSEATLVSAMLRLDRVGVAASSYNMAMESESAQGFRRTGSLLWHVYISNALGNRLPCMGDGEDYKKLFSALRDAQYAGRVSCEGDCSDFYAAAVQANRCLRAACNAV